MASRGLNKVMVIGNVGQDPEVRFMPNGNPVANVSIATSETWKDKQTGENREQTEWHRVVFFNRLAEIVGEYVKKGTKIYIEGSLRTRKWQDQAGNDRYSTEIIATEMQMLDRRDGTSGGDYTGYPESAEQGGPSRTTTQNTAQTSDKTTAEATTITPEAGMTDDDIPF